MGRRDPCLDYCRLNNKGDRACFSVIHSWLINGRMFIIYCFFMILSVLSARQWRLLVCLFRKKISFSVSLSKHTPPKIFFMQGISFFENAVLIQLQRKKTRDEAKNVFFLERRNTFKLCQYSSTSNIKHRCFKQSWKWSVSM